MAGYLRALTGIAKRPGSRPRLPERSVRRSVTSDPQRLAAYHRMCGFPLRDRLPATWLHVLSFPLQLELMAARDFPFSVLGMVHIANDITQHRPVLAGDSLEMTCRAENLRPHRRGALVDLVVDARRGDDLVWQGTSGYLVKGARAGSGEERETAPDARPDPAGLVPAARWRLPADLGRRYAAVSGDVNPIHLSSVTARAFGFPGAIAHGMWTQARLLAALDARLPEAFTARIEFAKPMLLGRSVEVARHPGPLDYVVFSGERLHAWGGVRPAV